MSHKIIKFGMLALVALALTYCQREDAPEAPQQDPVPAVDPQAVVSLNEAKSLFEASENQKRTANSVSRRKYPFIELETDWRYFEQTQTLVGDAYSKIPVTIVGSDLSAEILFLKKDGITEQTLFVTKIDSLTSDNRIVNADFYLFTPKGEFISAYRMKEGVITHELVPKYKGRYRLVVDTEVAQAGRKGGGLDDFTIACDCATEYSNGDCECDKSGGDDLGSDENPIRLQEVTVVGKRKKRINNSYTPYPSYTPYTPNNNGFPIKEGGAPPRGGSNNVGAGLAIDGDNTAEEEKEDTIKDSLTNRCAKALLAQAPNLNNDIAKILRETFGTNDKYNITVTEKPLSGMSGYSSFPEVRQNSIKAIIYLNSNMLGTATQEYALATIYHEVIHVFLNAEHAKLGETVFNQKYPSVTYQDYPVGNGQQTRRYKLRTDHSRFDAFLEKLAQSIISFNPNFTLERARAIAKEGIVEDFFISPTDATFIQEQKNGTNGTKCP